LQATFPVSPLATIPGSIGQGAFLHIDPGIPTVFAPVNVSQTLRID